MRAKYRTSTRKEPTRPLLLVDIDGVISLFSRAQGALAGSAKPTPAVGGAIEGSLHSIDGIPHYLSSTAAAYLLSLSRAFDLAWASGWEEKADEHLPHLLGVPAGLPFLRFARPTSVASASGSSLDAHWKLQAVDAFAGARTLAWIDDAFNPACHAWAAARAAPTLLVSTAPERGLTELEATQLEAWAAGLAPR